MTGDWMNALKGTGYEMPDGLRLERAAVNVSDNTMHLRFSVSVFPTPQMQSELNKALAGVLPDTKVRAGLSCPALCDDFLVHPENYAEGIAAWLVESRPAFKPYMPGTWTGLSDVEVGVRLSDPLGLKVMTGHGGAQELESLLHSLFRKKIAVAFTAPGDMSDKMREVARALRAEDERLHAEYHKRVAAESRRPSVLFGKMFDPMPVPIIDLLDDSGRVCILGRVLAVDGRELKGGQKKLVLFDVTDGTSTIPCKAFPLIKDAAALAALQVGEHVAVRGDCQIDKFSGGELSILASDVLRIPHEERRDDEPVKRVELHCHTQMSAMDGVSSAASLVSRAKAFGHPAIAITDHGVTQAFPEAVAAGKGIKVIFGVEGYLLDDAQTLAPAADTRPLSGPFVVVDVETTGLSPHADRLTEIAAVRVEGGQIVDRFSTFVNPGMPIPQKVVELTSITDAMVKDAPDDCAAIQMLAQWAGDLPLVAHNASFDLAFLRRAANKANVSLSPASMDTLALARLLVPGLGSYKLEPLCKKLGIRLSGAHRAINDAEATAALWHRLVELASQKGASTPVGLLELAGDVGRLKGGDTYHIILLAATQDGLKNLNTLVSESHLKYFDRQPRIPRHRLQALREGLIVGSACEGGELFQHLLRGDGEQELARIAQFYDYLEIQPLGNNAFLLRNGMAESEEGLQNLNRRILALGDRLGKPVVATCDVHFLDEEDAVSREILMAGMGFTDAGEQAPLYLRTTGEMLEEFGYLGEEAARRVVIQNTNLIADRIADVSLFPKHPEGKPTFQPNIKNAEQDVESAAWTCAHEWYGEDLPPVVETRLQKELGCIIGYGFATLYQAAKLLIQDSNRNGYLVGSRGSVGSSFAATMLGITEVNPLPPHYRCVSCRYSDFSVDAEECPCGIDLPPRECPVCGQPLRGDGFDIPFEVFLGFKGDKVPDIDLNFSGEYQARAHRFVETMFGPENCYRAGTIGTLAEKTAFGFVTKWLESKKRVVPRAEVDRLVRGCTGVKRTTGQHPGGMVIVPDGMNINSFCPVQHPADDEDGGTVTTHFDFNSLHDLLVKLDILGHDDPTMIRRLEDLTGVRALDLPLADPGVMSLFQSPEKLGVSAQDLDCRTGTLGVPEFGTSFVRGMLEDTKPTTMGELVRISGLSHGENVWLGNAQDLVRGGKASLRQCICTRDDIMNALIAWGMESKLAFDIMESVRKGKGLRPEWEAAMLKVNPPEWFIDACKKIGYMFPRAHAAAYVMMALRIAWYKLYRPQAYYAAFFSIRATAFDANYAFQSVQGVTTRIGQIASMGREASAKEKDSATVLESIREMLLRGFTFRSVDLYRSHHTDFLIDGDGLLPPFGCLPGVGETAARSLFDAAAQGPFISVEELKARARVSTQVIAALRDAGCLKGLQEKSQASIFDLMLEQ